MEVREMTRSIVLECAKPIHQVLRARKLNMFFQLTDHADGGTLLDVGGGFGIAGEFLPLYRSYKVTAVNLNPLRFNSHQQISLAQCVADGCLLPFKSKAFDWVFSNAVIEHVGGWEKQQMFANEIRRVASKGYFITTPNKWFPIEPHTMLPLFQFLPPELQKKLINISPGYVRAPEEINLLYPSQVQTLFPEAEVKCVGFWACRNSVVALHKAKVNA